MTVRYWLKSCGEMTMWRNDWYSLCHYRFLPQHPISPVHHNLSNFKTFEMNCWEHFHLVPWTCRLWRIEGYWYQWMRKEAEFLPNCLICWHQGDLSKQPWYQPITLHIARLRVVELEILNINRETSMAHQNKVDKYFGSCLLLIWQSARFFKIRSGQEFHLLSQP